MKSFIKKCDWEITTKCNLNCKHCLINHHPKKELSTEDCFLIIDLLRKLGCKQLNFTGGEALIKKDFFKILDYSNKKRIINNLFTNGTQINKKNINYLKRYISYIGVSLEGMEKENDFVRGKGSYNKTINAIKLLNKVKIPFAIYLTLNKKNIKNLKRTLKKIKKFNYSHISLNELVLRGRARKNKRELYLNVNRKEIFGILKAIFPNEKFKVKKGCDINPRRIFLTSEGKFYFCTEIQQFKKTKNLKNSTLPKFNEFSKFSKNFSRKKMPKKCPYVSYFSKHITLNFLTGEKCPYLK